jgi:hypothetical protein
VVPSEDYSHRPPRFAGFVGEGRETEAEQQSTKKKTMKTNKQNKPSTKNNQQSTNSGLPIRSEQSSENSNRQTATAPETEAAPEKTINNQPSTINAPVKPYVNFAEREFNRKLPMEKVLEKLRRWMPQQYELAEVVGKWVWISFPEPPIERVRADLSQLGFHWNNTRKCWQHPCGETLPRGQQEPRDKYSTYFPSQQAAA